MDCDANYDIKYVIRGSGSSIPQNTISIVEWGRKLDDVSAAKITHILSDASCCDELGRIEPWADRVEIRRNGSLVWMGWVTAVEYSYDTVVVEAKDALIFSRYRWFSADYDKLQDSVFHWRDLWDQTVGSLSPYPIPVDVITTNTNVIENRKYSSSYRRIVWFLLKEIMEGSVDVTVMGTQVLVGALSVAGVLTLAADDFAGDIVLRKAGEFYAGQVGVEGARGIRGEYPPGLVTGNGFYPLIQDLVFDESIISNASAEAVAKSRYEYTNGIVPRLVRAGDALTLRQGALDISLLIPGRLVSVDTEGLCVGGKQEFRLGSVDVSYTGGVESIGISLQPVGSNIRVEDITPDDDSGGAVSVDV